MSKQKIPEPQGFSAPGFESVIDAFKSGFSQGIDKGASVAVYFKGSLVVRAWGGLADEQAKRPWKEDGYGYFFSVAKFLSGIVVADLVEKGLLDYDEKIAKYWPEFGQNGKEGITLRMLLSHQAGLSMADEDYHLQWMRDDPIKLRKVLETQRPLWVPGKEHGYSMVLLGPYLNEIVQRVDLKGRNVSDYFRDEIAVPFDLDLQIGVPKSLFHRTPRLTWQEISQEQTTNFMVNFPGDINLYRRSLREPKDWNARWRINDPDYASLPCPSSHAIGTTRAVAKLAGILSNGGVHEGKTLLGQSRIEALGKPVAHGMDFIHCTKWTYGLGAMLIPARMGNKTWFLFGHTGLGGQCVWVDPLHGLGLAYNTNHMDLMVTFQTNRWKHLLEAAYGCILGSQGAQGDQGRLRLFEGYQEFLDDLKIHPITNSSKL